MRIRTFCSKCNKNATPETFKEMYVEVVDNSIYEFTCEYGHENVIILQESKFELLFEMGVMAFVDGYYREAVASLAASIERLYEFYILAVAQNRGIDEIEISCTWKNVKNQSERQIGAFFFLYLLENGKRPEVLANKFIEFRNNVIHKGYFPTKEEVNEYGDAIVRITDNIMDLLVTNYKESVHKLITEAQREYIKKCEGKQYSIMSIPTSICLSRPSLIGTRRFMDMVKERMELRFML